MSEFKEAVYGLVAQIPPGKVMTYGQIAALCGQPRAARIVGQIAHFGPEDLPWQRVVKRSGDLASGYYGGRSGHKKDLEAEGIDVSDDFTLDVDKYIWWPPGESDSLELGDE